MLLVKVAGARDLPINIFTYRQGRRVQRYKSPQITKIATYAGFADPHFQLQQRA